MCALILIYFSVMHNLKFRTCQIIFYLIFTTTFYEQLVDIFVLYLHIKFHIPLPKQSILDTHIDPVILVNCPLCKTHKK